MKAPPSQPHLTLTSYTYIYVYLYVCINMCTHILRLLLLWTLLTVQYNSLSEL